MKTKYIILALAIFIAPAAMAQEYFAKLRSYFGDNSPIVQKQNTLKVHNTFTNPENGEKEGELTICKFVLPESDVSYTDSVRVQYEAISQAMDNGKIRNRSI